MRRRSRRRCGGEKEEGVSLYSVYGEKKKQGEEEEEEVEGEEEGRWNKKKETDRRQ